MVFRRHELVARVAVDRDVNIAVGPGVANYHVVVDEKVPVVPGPVPPANVDRSMTGNLGLGISKATKALDPPGCWDSISLERKIADNLC